MTAAPDHSSRSPADGPARRAIEMHKDTLCRELRVLRYRVNCRRIARTVKENPLSCLLIAAGASFLLARAACRVNDEHKPPTLLGSPWADAVGKMAKEMINTLQANFRHT